MTKKDRLINEINRKPREISSLLVLFVMGVVMVGAILWGNDQATEAANVKYNMELLHKSLRHAYEIDNVAVLGLQNVDLAEKNVKLNTLNVVLQKRIVQLLREAGYTLAEDADGNPVWVRPEVE